MPTIKELLSSEQSKDRLCIQLYSEGIFFKAYEHSAWLVYHILNRFIQTMPAVSKRSISLCFCGASHSGRCHLHYGSGKRCVTNQGILVAPVQMQR